MPTLLRCLRPPCLTQITNLTFVSSNPELVNSSALQVSDRARCLRL